MPERTQTDSQQLLRRLRDTMAEEQKGQARLNKITHLIADSMGTEVCSIYLFRDNETPVSYTHLTLPTICSV